METGFSLKYNISIKGCLILNTLLKIFSIKLFYWYFVNTILMTSSLKFSIKELCHDFVCSFRIDKSSGHNRILASLCCRAKWAISGIQQRAARIP